MEYCSLWLNACLYNCLSGDSHTYHVRVIGPRNSGKTSIIRCLAKGAPISDDAVVGPTDGTEITHARLPGGTSFVLYETDDGRHFDLPNAKRINSSNIALRPPEALVFVVDGSDVGRLPLTFKILREVVEIYYKVEIILVLISKAAESASPRNPNSYRVMPSMGRWMTPSRSEQTTADNVCVDFAQKEYLESPLLRPNEVSTPTPHHMQMDRNHQGTAVSLQQIAKLMSHPTLFQKQWKAFYCSARTGQGIEEAFEWLASALSC